MNPIPSPLRPSDQKAGLNLTEGSPASSISAPAAGIQVFEGDGVSEQDRFDARAAATLRGAASTIAKEVLKPGWTVQTQQDFVQQDGEDLAKAFAEEAKEKDFNEMIIQDLWEAAKK